MENKSRKRGGVRGAHFVVFVVLFFCLAQLTQIPRFYLTNIGNDWACTRFEPPIIATSNRTKRNVTENPPKLYYCEDPNGNEVGPMIDLVTSVLPEYVLSDFTRVGGGRWYTPYPEIDNENGNDYDVFLLSIGASCKPRVANWILHHYRGKILLWSPESAQGPRNFRDFVYELGPVYESDSGQSEWHSMRLYHLQIIFFSIFHRNRRDGRFHYERSGDFLLDPNKKPKNTGKHFLVYAQANCQPHRDEAFVKLSEIGVVHSSGRCGGEGPNRVKVVSNVSLGNWGDNALFYKDYRFCLTMEHGLHEGYITEKILMGFFAGCIPIYWGPTSIFDLFSQDTFVYYNIINPQPALDRIRYLESNQTAYMEMLHRAPILRNGKATVEKYFSFSDEVGGGKLKKRIRKFLELDRFDFLK